MLATDSVEVGGIPFTRTSFNDAVKLVIDVAVDGRPVAIRLANAYCVASASKDRSYAELLSSSGINFPDGQPVVWAMRLNRTSRTLCERVRGPSLFRSTIDLGRAHSVRHFFLGTTPATLLDLQARIALEYPGTAVAGSFAPPFGELTPEFYSTVVAEILATDAQIVWVALGSPKQDFAAEIITQLTSIPCVGVGAAFDFLAGTQDEAPTLVQRSGFEWMYRLIKELRRLWRRYIFGNIRFLAVVVGRRKRR